MKEILRKIIRFSAPEEVSAHIKKVWAKTADSKHWGRLCFLKNPRVTPLDDFKKETLWQEYTDTNTCQIYQGPDHCYWDQLFIVSDKKVYQMKVDELEEYFKEGMVCANNDKPLLVIHGQTTKIRCRDYFLLKGVIAPELPQNDGETLTNEILSSL